MHAVVIPAGFALSGSEEARQRIRRTHKEIFTENILGQDRDPQREKTDTPFSQARG
jgi:hypothetical protein